MRLIYNIAAVLAVILMVPAFFLRSIREKGFTERLKQQLGNQPKEAIEKVAGKNCIWVHAASVGEIVAASPLIKEFHKEFPKSPILVSVFTNNGYEMAQRIIKDADSIIYLPFDLPWITPNLMRKIKPRVFMPVETELWPNLLQEARRMNVTVMMVNGRISEKSVKSYRYLNSMWDDMRDTFSLFAMQSPIDAEYILRLGAKPELVTVTGNTKYDQTYTNVDDEEKKSIIKSMGLDDNQGIFLAGSTHPGEEEAVINAFAEVRKKFPRAKLLIAPRAILRAEEIGKMCEAKGFNYVTRKQLQENPELKGHDAVILNTIGELGKVYSIGDVVFVGGSLIKHGGHNILEPAAHGKAIVTGCNMFNFKETHALFSGRNAVITVNDEAELVSAAVELFSNEEKRHKMEADTLKIIEENQGAARKTAVLLRKVLMQARVRSTDRTGGYQTFFYKMINGETSRNIFVRGFIHLLHALSYVYGALVYMKLEGYHMGLFKQKELDCFVISLGNITVGGTGKTPTAQQLARKIRDMGYKVVILNRGYRAKWHGDVGIVSDGKSLLMEAAQSGDEAYMLAKHLPKVPVLIGRERSVSGQYAVENFGAQVAILDDGFQHWQLKRDLDIVLIDSVNVFGNGYMLPRGSLREPLSHLQRAKVCLLTKVDQAKDGSCEYIREKIAHYNVRAQIVESIHQPKACIELNEWRNNIADEGIPVEEMAGKRVVAVSAIGNPASFEQTVRRTGADLIESVRFPDHHDYTSVEMLEVMEQAVQEDAEAILITEKDAVKIPDLSNETTASGKVVPIYVLTIAVKITKGEKEFYDMLKRKIEKKFNSKG